LTLLSKAAAAAQLKPPSHNDSTSVKPFVFLSDGTDDEPAIIDIVRSFNLNEEQERALRIVVYHSLGRSKVGSQLLMGLFGEGGTGKSTVINAIRASFALKYRQHELLITATTGSAAFNIKGITLHSACNLPIGNEPKTVGNNKQKEWAPRQYLIIDEVSMLDLKTLWNLDQNLRTAKNNKDEPFGGVNIIFIGDFMQMATVSHLDLYEDCATKGIDGEHCRMAHDLWRSLNAVVLLTQQMQQSDDPEFAAALRRLRIHEPTAEDIDLLNSRVGAPLQSKVPIPVVVRHHKLRNIINWEKLLQQSEQLNVPIMHCLAHITSRSGKISREETLKIKGGAKKVTGDGILSVIPGVRLMVNKNIDTSLGYHCVSTS